jgi:hypothetical protein
MIDIQYLIALGEAGGVIPRWQEVPDAAKLKEKDFWRLKSYTGYFMLPAVSFTYCWLSPAHPDPIGWQLQQVLPFLKLLMKSAREEGNEHTTMGVMQDYLSFPQEKRSDHELERFKFGLKNELNIWYTHPYIPALMIDIPAPNVPEHTNCRPYSGRGWCCTEKRLCSIVKDGYCFLSLALFSGQEDLLMARRSMAAERVAPWAPDKFGSWLRDAVAKDQVAFTSGSDLDLVIGIYEKGFVHAFNTYREIKNIGLIHFTLLRWGDDAIDALEEAFTYADKHCTFDEPLKIALGLGNKFTDDGKNRLMAAFSKFSKFKCSVESS